MNTPNELVMLHLGVGAFHRAHQAWYMHRLREQQGQQQVLSQAAPSDHWSLAGGNTRPDMLEVMQALAAQGGAYTLETVTPQNERSYERIESIRSIVPYEPSLAGLIEVGAHASTRIISFTVTEAGYYQDANDRLDLTITDLAADLERAKLGQAGSSIYAALTAILRERMLRGGGKVTLLNCDNLRHNGQRVRSGLLSFIELAGDSALHAWVLANTTCPNAMVDRITPRPAPDLRPRVQAATGWDDAAPVMGESFIQWVIEDNFCNGRPAWESVGVQMVESVAAFEEAKIRILNATHSCIAWAGTLAGYQYIHEGVHDPRIRKMAYDYVTNDVMPCLDTPAHPSPLPLAAYRDVVLDRFGNPAIQDTNQRVAADGFAKIPGFIAPTVRECLARGASIDAVAMLPALFLGFLQRWHRGQLSYVYQDQAMDAVAAHAICEAADPVAALAGNTVLWAELASDPRLVAALRKATAQCDQFIKKAAYQ